MHDLAAAPDAAVLRAPVDGISLAREDAAAWTDGYRPRHVPDAATPPTASRPELDAALTTDPASGTDPALTSDPAPVTDPSPASDPAPAADEPVDDPTEDAVTQVLRRVIAASAAAVTAAGPQAADGAGAGRIRVTSPAALEPLVVADDGVGIAPAEVRALLRASVSGGDAVDALGRALAGDAGGAALAGTLRDCFRIAEVVEIHSRPAGHPEAATMRVTVTPDGRARLSLAGVSVSTSGTQIRLHVSPEHRAAVGPDALPDLVRRVAGSLPVAISVDGVDIPTAAPEPAPAATPATGTVAPPHEAPAPQDDPASPQDEVAAPEPEAPDDGSGPLLELEVLDLGPGEREAWFTEQLGEEPLVVLPLEPGPSGIRAVAAVPAGTEDTFLEPVLVGAAGLLDSSPSAAPPWAEFCALVVDTADLPVADEALVPGPELDAARAHLGLALLAALVRFEAESPVRFGRLIAVHPGALDAGSLAHRNELHRVRELLVVPTTLGPRSVAALCVGTDPVPFGGTDLPDEVYDDAARAELLIVDAREPWVLRLLDIVDSHGPGFVRVAM